MDIQEAFDISFEAVKNYVDRSLDAVDARLQEIDRLIAEDRAADTGNGDALMEIKAALGDRIAALEQRPVPEKGEPGRDGIGIAGALIDRGGELVLTMTDGSTKSLGLVIGRDGAPGGDGLGFDDLELEHDGERTIIFRFTRGELVKQFPVTFPVPIYRGVYQEGRAYERGDMVTFGGSVFHANDHSTNKPEDAGKAWTLAVKRGRDGRSVAK